MFAKEVYVRRRATLLRKMQEAGEKGLILFVGNAEAPAQYKDNCYKWRQDSSWLYFMGLDEPLMAALLDIDAGTETLFADDVDIDDIIWMGPQPSVRSKADAVGVAETRPYGALEAAVAKALAAGRTLHFLPPSRLPLQFRGLPALFQNIPPSAVHIHRSSSPLLSRPLACQASANSPLQTDPQDSQASSEACQENPPHSVL